ncbi:DUF2399 domain-containing protein [Kitasatospora sp. NPDC056138]|uniref:DUF2399 domain-containing protein n=1 Tax=Kitasatospora sp. NPDC056138 TaxID=3345724 RepID=UPI0035DA7088
MDQGDEPRPVRPGLIVTSRSARAGRPGRPACAPEPGRPRRPRTPHHRARCWPPPWRRRSGRPDPTDRCRSRTPRQSHPRPTALPGQLGRSAQPVHVSENPGVLALAVGRFGPHCPAVDCTSGRPDLDDSAGRPRGRGRQDSA